MPEVGGTRHGGSAEVRPGAMTRAMRAVRPSALSGPRWLRWALVRDGRIVRDGTLSPERTLTVGSDGDVPCASVRGTRPLAYAREGGWVLSLHASWRGRIGAVALAEHRLEWTEIALEGERAQGRIEIGDVALLVQVVERPPVRPAPVLPAVLRGGVLSGADWRFTAFIAGSFMLHFGFVVAVIEADFPYRDELIPADHVAIIFDAPDPPPDEAIPEEPMNAREDGDAAPSDGESGPSDAPRHAHRRRATSPGEAEASVRAGIQEAVAGIAAIGAAFGPLAQGPAITEGELIGDASAPIATSDPSRLGLRGEECAGCPSGDAIGRLRAIAAHGSIPELEPVQEVRVVVPAPLFEPPIIDETPGFDTRELIRALQARMPAVRRCYEHELTQGNPDTEGRVLMTLTVMPVGTVSNIHAEENETGSASLAACTARSLRSVRVRVGPSEPVEVRYPIVFRRPGG